MERLGPGQGFDAALNRERELAGGVRVVGFENRTRTLKTIAAGYNELVDASVLARLKALEDRKLPFPLASS